MFTNIFLRFIGYIILRLRFRDKGKRDEVFNSDYDNSYLNAGAEYPLKIVAILLIGLLSIFLIVVIYSIFKHGPAPV